MWFGAVLGLTCYLCHAQSDYNAVQSELFRKHNANKEKKAFPQCEGGQHEGEKQGVITKLGHTKINDRDKVMIVSFSIVRPSCGMTPCFFSSLCFVPSLYATSGKERYPSQQKNVVSYVAMGGSLVQVLLEQSQGNWRKVASMQKKRSLYLLACVLRPLLQSSVYTVY